MRLESPSNEGASAGLPLPPRPPALLQWKPMRDRLTAVRPKRGLRLLSLGLLALSALPLPGCSNGGECDKCKVDADCKAPLVCSTFLNSDGSVNSTRCGSGTGP